MPRDILRRPLPFAGEAPAGTADRNPGRARLRLGDAEAGAADIASGLAERRRALAALAEAVAAGDLVPGSGEGGAFTVTDTLAEGAEPDWPVDDRTPEFGEPIPADWSPDDPTGGGVWVLHQPTYRISPGGQCGASTTPVIPPGGFVVAAETSVVGSCFDDEGVEIIGDLLEVTLTVYAPA